MTDGGWSPNAPRWNQRASCGQRSDFMSKAVSTSRHPREATVRANASAAKADDAKDGLAVPVNNCPDSSLYTATRKHLLDWFE
ncbi:hypothetical protein PIB30_066561 [Stylosanthes scabra]|uniref:Uncharacterized protein n=1 Tax=Stylosanthes scabra TaxID=79078 RepID=A0ABU6ZL42_9FABA|nr:hypothetical protein [Stylosanthes scabra]